MRGAGGTSRGRIMLPGSEDALERYWAIFSGLSVIEDWKGRTKETGQVADLVIGTRDFNGLNWADSDGGSKKWQIIILWRKATKYKNNEAQTLNVWWTMPTICTHTCTHTAPPHIVWNNYSKTSQRKTSKNKGVIFKNEKRERVN